MVIYGSASIVRTLTNLGLIDTYQLLVFPVVLGSGKPLFREGTDMLKLQLLDTKTFSSGIAVLKYQPIGKEVKKYDDTTGK
jgi:dihydrofolate reductase